MPNIDTSTIEGFADMTAEQKVEALLGIEIPEKVDLTQFVPKSTADKWASELAEAKKREKAHMTEDEVEKAEREAKWAEMEEKVQRLEREKTESTYKAKYLAMPGFTEELAEETAKAMAAGDMDKVFANQQKANEAREKSLRAEILKGTPHPNGAGGDDDNKTPANVELAANLGKAKAESTQSSNDILKHYI